MQPKPIKTMKATAIITMFNNTNISEKQIRELKNRKPDKFIFSVNNLAEKEKYIKIIKKLKIGEYLLTEPCSMIEWSELFGEFEVEPELFEILDDNGGKQPFFLFTYYKRRPTVIGGISYYTFLNE